jgi:hypothetical protein
VSDTAASAATDSTCISFMSSSLVMRAYARYAYRLMSDHHERRGLIKNS